MDYSAAIDTIHDQRLDFIEMLTEHRKQLQVTIIELSITSPWMISSPDFALVFDNYRKIRDTAVVTNLDLLEERAKALMSQED